MKNFKGGLNEIKNKNNSKILIEGKMVEKIFIILIILMIIEDYGIKPM